MVTFSMFSNSFMGTYPFLLSITFAIIPKIRATAMFVSVTAPTEIVIPPMPVIKI